MKYFRSFTLIFCLLILFTGIARADTVQVGTGTLTNSYLPIYTLYSYNYSQQIYTQAQINHAGEISKVRFYYTYGSLGASYDWKIYMGHSQRTQFSDNSDWEPIANLTEVFDGSVSAYLPEENNWMEIPLDTAFDYNNQDNLIVAVYEDTPGWDSTISWGAFASGANTGIYFYSDSVVPSPQNPPAANNVVSNIAQIQLVFPSTTAPLAPTLIAPANGEEVYTNAVLRWMPTAGAGDATSYDLYFGQNPNPPLLAAGITATTYSPTLEGDSTYYWKLVAHNNIGSSPASEIWSFDTTPSGVIQIGEGTTATYRPFSTLWGYERSASIYRQDQIGTYGMVTRLAWNVATAGTVNTPYKIFLKTVAEDAHLSSSWDTFVADATLVKEGNYTFNSTGWHNFVLDTPFVYTTGNLVVIVQSDVGGSGQGGYPQLYYTASAGSQHQYWYADNSPPTGAGTMNSNLANIMMHIAPPTGDPSFMVNPTNWNFGDVRIGGNKDKSFNVVNIGGGQLGISQISISGNPAFTLGNLPALPASLGPAQNLNFTVNFAPTATETVSAVVTIVDDLGNRSTHTVNISGTGVHDLTIGDGSSSGRIPLDYYYRASIYQGLYNTDDMQNSSGMITGVKLYSSFLTNLINMPVKVWLGTTQMDDLSQNWVPASELDLVFDDNVNFPTGQNTIEFAFSQPFMYFAGQNLVIMFKRPLDTTYYSSSDQFRVQSLGQNRARNLYNDSSDYDENNPGTGGLSSILPMITFQMLPLSDEPTLVVNPNPWNFGDVVIGSTVEKRFVLANAGSGSVTVSDISFSGNAYYEILDLPTLPFTVQSGQTRNFRISYNPQEAGTHTATVTVTDNRSVTTVPISGTCYDPSIVEFSYVQDFEDWPPPDWDLTGGSHQFSQYTDPGGNNWAQAYYWGQSSGSTNYLTSPPILSPDALKLKFTWSHLYSSSYPQDALAVEVSTNLSNWTQVWQKMGSELDSSDGAQSTIPGSGVQEIVTLGGNLVNTRFFIRFKATSGYGPSLFLDDVMLDLIQPNDLAATRLTGNTTPSVGIASDYTVYVYNNGSVAQSDYTVKLYNHLHAELATAPGQTVASDATVPVILSWTPTNQGPVSIYAKVILAGDGNPTNDSTPLLLLNVQPEGVLGITIGDGSQQERMPFDFYWRNSLYETLYYPDEMTMLGTITALSLYTNFSQTVNNTPLKIWMGIADVDDLSNTWVPATELIQVFDGNVDFPTGENTITIPLDTLFPYTGGNLVVMYNRPMDTQYFSSTNYFKVQNPGIMRARNNYSDSETFVPDSPNGGTATGIFPKTTFFMTPMTGDPVCLVNPGSYNFGDVTLGGSKSKSFTVINAGGGTLGLTNIAISGSNAMSLSATPNLPASLNTGQSVSFTVTYAPTMIGADAATVSIMDDQGRHHSFSFSTGNPQKRSAMLSLGSSRESRENREIHTVAITGSGVNDITVGNGAALDRVPMDFYWRNSLYETIYTQDELGNFVGMITGIRFYNDFQSNLNQMPTKIWFGSTTQTNLGGNWIPATDLDLVFDGNVNYPSGQNTITINFPEPYLHLDSGNLIMMVSRPMDTDWHSYSDNFKTNSGNTNRSMNVYSDSETFDPYNPTDGSSTGSYPMTTFIVIPGGVGHITGTVYGPDTNPLPGVTVTLDSRPVSVQTNAQGEFAIPNQLPGNYNLSFVKHTYVSQSLDISLEEDQTLELDINMAFMPQVTLSGTIQASDTSQGIAGAHIALSGYETFHATSTANGSFSIPTVFANQSYNYVISAAGYTSLSGIVAVGAANHNMGTLVMNEVAYAPNSVTAALNATYDAVQLSWNAPDPNAVEIIEGFESTEFPPHGWSQIITNTGVANALGVYPTWCNFGAINISGSSTISPTEGSKQAGLRWDYEHQDEWLKTPSFNCPPDAYLSFDTYVTNGSDGGDHYYVKVSTNGGSTWTALWDATTLPAGNNYYDYPINIDLAPYAGSEIILAFHAEDPPSNDGLHHDWLMDKVYIGNMAQSLSFRAADLRAGKSDMRSLPALASNQAAATYKNHNRALIGYHIWRLAAGQENNENTWIPITTELLDALSFEDSSWNSLPNGSYKWAIKAIYTADVSSAAAFSNPLQKEQQNGNVVGFVRRQNGQGIAGATITASSGNTATTNSAGAYSMVLPVGSYSITATANGFHPNTIENVIVVPNQNVTVNFEMIPTSNEDELIPVTITQLNGNYPNPFNPETIISYDIKDACYVSLEIYNLRGQLVRTLVKDTLPSGRYRTVFNARDDKGLPLGSGVYFYRFTAGDYRATRKMLLME